MENPFEGIDTVEPEQMELLRQDEPPATEPQVKFLRDLVKERDIEQLSGNLYERAFDVSTDAGKFISKQEASALIRALKELPVTKSAPGNPPEGIHFWDGKVYKVQVAHHGSGKKYAKELSSSSINSNWVYVGRGPEFRALSVDTLMTKEQAEEFGKLYGMCAICGRTLTDEGSIERGIGPVCAGKQGW